MAGSPVAPVPLLTFEIHESAKETIIHCTGKIVSDTCASFQDTVRGLLSEGKSTVVDLRKVSSIDSAGLGALVALWSSAKRRSVEMDIRWGEHPHKPSPPDLKIVNANERVTKLLRLTRLDKLFGPPEERD